MSDDEEMSDLSQVATQSGSIACTSMSLSNQEAETEPTEPWGEINIFKITRRRLGLRGNMTHYSKQQLRVYGRRVMKYCTSMTILLGLYYFLRM